MTTNLHLAQIVITSGEPAGIGPDICLALIHDPSFRARYQGSVRLTLLGSSALFAMRAQKLGLPPLPAQDSLWQFIDFPTSAVAIGKASPQHAEYVLSMIRHAVHGCQQRRYHAMVTAPIQKSTLIQGGYPHFLGHTEYLAELCHQPPDPAPQSLMMLTQAASNATKDFPPLRVCLATTHIPLNAVSRHLNVDGLMAVAKILSHDLIARYRQPHPRIAVLGLNPHAGEGGNIGKEEIKVIIPFIDKARKDFPQVDWQGPLSADTAFIAEHRRQFDGYLGMFHDQVLPVFKSLTFGSGVNVTLGLPIVRTSVDHGTALSLAGTGKARTEGLKNAIAEAIFLAPTH